MSSRRSRWVQGLGTLLVVAACDDATDPALPDNPLNTAGATTEVVSSVRWNRQGISLFRAFGNNPGRTMAYLSMAQYQAALAAEEARPGSKPWQAGAVAGASVAVLKGFYSVPGAVSAIDAQLQRARQRCYPGSARWHQSFRRPAARRVLRRPRLDLRSRGTPAVPGPASDTHAGRCGGRRYAPLVQRAQHRHPGSDFPPDARRRDTD